MCLLFLRLGALAVSGMLPVYEVITVCWPDCMPRPSTSGHRVYWLTVLLLINRKLPESITPKMFSISKLMTEDGGGKGEKGKLKFLEAKKFFPVSRTM